MGYVARKPAKGALGGTIIFSTQVFRFAEHGPEQLQSLAAF